MAGKARVKPADDASGPTHLEIRKRVAARVFKRKIAREERESSARIMAEEAKQFKHDPFRKPATAAHTGLSSSQAKPSQTDKGPRNERLALLAHRHEQRSRALAARASDASRATANRLTLAGKANTHIEGKAGDDAFAGSAALNGRSALHLGVANRLREAIHDPAKSAAAGRTLKSLENAERGSGRNRILVRDMGHNLTHEELKAAAAHAGITHGTTTKQGLVEHLAANVGKAKGPTLREQADRHRAAKGDRLERSGAITDKARSLMERHAAAAHGFRRKADAARGNSGDLQGQAVYYPSRREELNRKAAEQGDIARGHMREAAKIDVKIHAIKKRIRLLASRQTP